MMKKNVKIIITHAVAGPIKRKMYGGRDRNKEQETTKKNYVYAKTKRNFILIKKIVHIKSMFIVSYQFQHYFPLFALPLLQFSVRTFYNRIWILDAIFSSFVISFLFLFFRFIFIVP